MDCSFEVQPTDEFLSVYVWGVVQNNRADMLLGRVSFLYAVVNVPPFWFMPVYIIQFGWCPLWCVQVTCKLSTVALSCLMTGGHRHEEKFHLEPSRLLRNVMKLVLYIHTKVLWTCTPRIAYNAATCVWGDIYIVGMAGNQVVYE